MDGSFGVLGDNSLWLWERKRRRLPLDYQCIDGVADGVDLLLSEQEKELAK
jgi:hypothetical protein